jgi:uncharacterized protein
MAPSGDGSTDRPPHPDEHTGEDVGEGEALCQVRVLVAGEVSGPVLVLDEPLSFWGGMDPHTGAIIDARHPQRGQVLTGAVVVMPAGRGSSSSSSVLAEAVRLGTAPAAIVLASVDVIVALGAMIPAEIYGVHCPVVVCDGSAYDRVAAADHLEVVASTDPAVIRRSSA